MKILIIGPNNGMGGVERSSINLANGFAEEGYCTKYVALIPTTQFYELHPDVIYIEPKKINKPKINLIRTLLYIRKEVKSFEPNSIIGFTKFYAALANLALCGLNYNLFVTERSSPLYKWPKKIEFLCKLSFHLRNIRGVISQTSIASEYHKIYYKSTKFTVIPNALREVKLFPEIKREKIILSVGRFNDDCKGFDLLVKAFNLILDNEWRLVFAGGSKYDGRYLTDLAKNDSIKNRIEFLGVVKDIDRIYSKAGIFVMPSRSEGFPNALVEAMAAGCPCISFDFIAGPQDIITHELDGILVESENVYKLAKSIDDLIIDRQKREMLSRNSIKISKRLHKNVIVNQHINFILSE